MQALRCVFRDNRQRFAVSVEGIAESLSGRFVSLLEVYPALSKGVAQDGRRPAPVLFSLCFSQLDDLPLYRDHLPQLLLTAVVETDQGRGVIDGEDESLL